MELYERLEQLLEGISMDFIRNNLKTKLNPYKVVLTKHFYDRAKERGISNKEFLTLLNRLFSQRNKDKLKNIKSKDILVKSKDLVVPFQKKVNDKLSAKSVFKNRNYITKKKGQYQLDLAEKSKNSIKEKIKKVDGKWAVYPSKGGDRLGTHSNKKDALKQLAAIEISKNKRKVKESFYKILEGESTSNKINILKEFLGSFK